MGINPEHVIFVSTYETKSVKNIARHLRNSISHYHFTAFNYINSNIHGVIFTGKNLRGKENFKANLSIEEIRLFINKFSAIMLETIANVNNMVKQLHPSDSSEQQQAHKEILALVNDKFICN